MWAPYLNLFDPSTMQTDPAMPTPSQQDVFNFLVALGNAITPGVNYRPLTPQAALQALGLGLKQFFAPGPTTVPIQ